MVRELGDIASEVEITLLRTWKADEVLSERSAWRVKRQTGWLPWIEKGRSVPRDVAHKDRKSANRQSARPTRDVAPAGHDGSALEVQRR